MKESLKLWRDIEKETGKVLLENGHILNFGHPDSEFLQGIFKQFPNDKLLNSEEIMERFPALKNLPDNYVGLVTDKGRSFLIIFRLRGNES